MNAEMFGSDISFVHTNEWYLILSNLGSIWKSHGPEINRFSKPFLICQLESSVLFTGFMVNPMTAFVCKEIFYLSSSFWKLIKTNFLSLLCSFPQCVFTYKIGAH